MKPPERPIIQQLVREFADHRGKDFVEFSALELRVSSVPRVLQLGPWPRIGDGKR